MTDLPLRLAARFPMLRPMVDEHLAFYEEMLPYVWLSELRAFLIESSATPRWWPASPARRRSRDTVRAVMAALESEYEQGDEQTRSLIALGFLESLPPPNERGGWLWDDLGPLLREEAGRVW